MRAKRIPGPETCMAKAYSVDVVNRLEDLFAQREVQRPMHVARYEPGAELRYAITGVAPARRATVRLEVLRFVGGGFAGQVYKVRLAEIKETDGPVEGLEVGGEYAVKILLPPTAFSQRFRDVVYKIGFQGPFALQCNPTAARAGALWQKFIRRAAALRFGDARAVVDIYATFVDEMLGSCGEISEWIDGRVWRFEVNDRIDELKKRKPADPVAPQGLSPEYCAKRKFMAEFVDLLHEIGAPEFARQYEWWTCKSQPNVLKRRNTENDPVGGLTAVDFRAGLALLPFLPMSPGDVPLICKGLARGSLVQFDRGNLTKLTTYVKSHGEAFFEGTGLDGAMEELVSTEADYRNGQIDVTHNHVRLLCDVKLWRTIFNATVAGWRVRNFADDATTTRLRRSKLLTMLFWLLGALPKLALAGAAALLIGGWARGDWPAWRIAFAIALPVLVSPLARLLRKLWGRADLRRHYGRALTSFAYFLRALGARRVEAATRWYRAGRLSDETALAVAANPLRYCLHLPLSILPQFLHRLLTDRQYAVELGRAITRPVRLFFNADLREQWLRDMVADGRRRHMLTDDDAQAILSRIKEPFIQKYLMSMAVHVCTLPVTQVVSVIVAIWYKAANQLTWGEAWDEMLFILAAFQLVPISPGSLVRGLYVLYLVIKERNFKDYNIAVFLGFFKYIGYLAFPIQMAYRYPVLARFMAGHWATGAVNIVPVFGEHGALLEHKTFDRFYNYPLTIRRRLGEKAKVRATMPLRTWHVVPIVLAAVGLLSLLDWSWLAAFDQIPRLRRIWPAAILLPGLAGAAAALWAGRSDTKRRILQGVVVGLITAAGYHAMHSALWLYAFHVRGITPDKSWLEIFGAGLLWRVFAFTVAATLGAIAGELFAPVPKTATHHPSTTSSQTRM
jgi:hypothetical protein